MIDSLNHDTSISELLQPSERIHRVLEKHKAALAERSKEASLK